MRTWLRQADGDVRFGWGPESVEALATDIVVVVDVLRFTSAVEAAVSTGARVYPYRWRDGSAASFAERVNAVLADGSDPEGPSLSPVRLARLCHGDAIVLPSPNGSTCAVVAHEMGATVIAACLRNAGAVAEWIGAVGGSVAVIACGERWPGGTLRPALEDQLGAGAVLARLHGVRSAEAEAAAALWVSLAGDTEAFVRRCASGVEATERGWTEDLEFACQIDVSTTVPVLVDGAFTAA